MCCADREIDATHMMDRERGDTIIRSGEGRGARGRRRGGVFARTYVTLACHCLPRAAWPPDGTDARAGPGRGALRVTRAARSIWAGAREIGYCRASPARALGGSRDSPA